MCWPGPVAGGQLGFSLGPAGSTAKRGCLWLRVWMWQWSGAEDAGVGEAEVTCTRRRAVRRRQCALSARRAQATDRPAVRTCQPHASFGCSLARAARLRADMQVNKLPCSTTTLCLLACSCS